MAKNFLDEAEDVTEEVGYKPQKPIAVKSKNQNFLDQAEDLGEAPEGAGKDVEPGVFGKILNVLDIPSSLVRTGVEAAANPARDVIPAVAEQIGKTIESPTTSAEFAPTGKDINKQIFVGLVVGLS